MKATTEHRIPNRESRAPSHESRVPIIFSDFDGTIAQVDVTDVILSEFADPAWREVEEEWVQGRIGSRECLKRQMAMVDASAKQLDALIDAVPLDPHFAAFHALSRERGIPFCVVSDGFDYVIRRVLRNCGVDGELLNGSHLFSSSMRVRGGSVEVDFPHWHKVCAHGCATCKPEVMRRVRGGHRPVIFIGDGLSDRFAVEEADVVFARDKLLGFCREHHVACTAFETFAEIEQHLEAVVASDFAGLD
jgi:2-hydroxy-3-keto-5-methylthiopentenyl-1-phosphate phosphatase